MNTIRSTKNKPNFFAPHIAGVMVAAALLVMTSASAQAQSVDPNSTLAWTNALKSVYKSSSTNSASTAAGQTLSTQAMTDPLCNQLIQAKTAAAQDYVKNKLPPDPTTAIANGSCFIDVMAIKIPVTGNGFLDSVVSSLSPFLKSNACQKTTGWWNDTKSKVLGGQFGSLGSQFSTVLSAVQNPNGSVTSIPTSGIQSFATAALASGVPAYSAYTTAVAAPSVATAGFVEPGFATSISGTTPQSSLSTNIATLRGFLGLP